MNMTPEARARIFLNHLPLLGPVRFHRLLEKWATAQTVLEQSAAGLRAAGISEELAAAWSRSFRDPAIRKRVDEEIEKAERGDFQILTELDESYPARLANFMDRPPVLYVKGHWPPSGWPVALVGTRRATRYGIETAAELTRALVRQGVVTISGLAAGIDAVVHQTTIDESGLTVAVLGHGFRFVYPRANERLYKEVQERGALVTEFPFERPPEAGQFPRRNRIISGLAEAVVVVEAPLRSGSLVTARYAAEQGRDVMAVPGPIFSPQSAGCHRLIQDGARLISDASQILEDGEGSKSAPARNPAAPENEKVDDLTPFEKKVWVNLENMPVTVDDLILLLQAPVDQLANALLSLELKGLVSVLPGQYYARNHR